MTQSVENSESVHAHLVIPYLAIRLGNDEKIMGME